jgi:hypothetical protein
VTTSLLCDHEIGSSSPQVWEILKIQFCTPSGLTDILLVAQLYRAKPVAGWRNRLDQIGKLMSLPGTSRTVKNG